MVHSISGWMRGVQVKLWDPLRTHAIPERLRGVIMTRCYTNLRLPYLTFQCIMFIVRVDCKFWYKDIEVWNVSQCVLGREWTPVSECCKSLWLQVCSSNMTVAIHTCIQAHNLSENTQKWHGICELSGKIFLVKNCFVLTLDQSCHKHT